MEWARSADQGNNPESCWTLPGPCRYDGNYGMDMIQVKIKSRRIIQDTIAYVWSRTIIIYLAWTPQVWGALIWCANQLLKLLRKTPIPMWPCRPRTSDARDFPTDAWFFMISSTSLLALGLTTGGVETRRRGSWAVSGRWYD